MIGENESILYSLNSDGTLGATAPINIDNHALDLGLKGDIVEATKWQSNLNTTALPPIGSAARNRYGVAVSLSGLTVVAPTLSTFIMHGGQWWGAFRICSRRGVVVGCERCSFCRLISERLIKHASISVCCLHLGGSGHLRASLDR